MGSMTSEIFDFIVVGGRVYPVLGFEAGSGMLTISLGGTSGCTVAWRLAHSKSRPTVLLVEAGGKNESKTLRADGDR
jgi:hypothetical protein